MIGLTKLAQELNQTQAVPYKTHPTQEIYLCNRTETINLLNIEKLAYGLDFYRKLVWFHYGYRSEFDFIRVREYYRVMIDRFDWISEVKVKWVVENGLLEVRY